MQEFETTLTEKGQVTIPQEVRRIIGLQPRDRVRFTVVGDVVTIKRASSKLLPGYGAVSPKKRPEDFQQVREDVEKGVAEDVISEA
jgi:antitoxin PrlF